MDILRQNLPFVSGQFQKLDEAVQKLQEKTNQIEVMVQQVKTPLQAIQEFQKQQFIAQPILIRNQRQVIEDILNNADQTTQIIQKECVQNLQKLQTLEKANQIMLQLLNQAHQVQEILGKGNSTTSMYDHVQHCQQIMNKITAQIDMTLKDASTQTQAIQGLQNAIKSVSNSDYLFVQNDPSILIENDLIPQQKVKIPEEEENQTQSKFKPKRSYKQILGIVQEPQIKSMQKREKKPLWIQKSEQIYRNLDF